MKKVIHNKYFICKVKNIIFPFFLICSIMSCAQEINPAFLGICKEKANELRLIYLDSKGITKINTWVASDTLVLEIQVSKESQQDFSRVLIPENVKYVKYGDVIKEIDKLEICSQIHAGDEARKYLESLKK